MASHRQKKCDDDDDVGSTTTTTTRTYPFVRYAKSRKIQKGEDVERGTVDARWTSKSVRDFERNPCRRRRDSSRDDDDDDDARLPANHHHSVEFVFASLFDGHGGKECAQFCAEETLECLLKALDSLEAELNDEEKTRVVETNRVRRSDDEYTLKKISRISRTRLSFFLSFSHSFTLSHTHSHTHSLSRAQNPEDVFEYLLPSALKLAFETLDEKFLRKDIHSGCTATVVIVNGRNVTTAAVGDSLAILDVPNRKGTSRLSNEHRLDCSDGERKRIVESGGEVRPTEFEDGPNGERRGVGPLRVWPGGLAISRSIGDRDGKKGGVIATPDVSRVLLERGANHSGGVMACRIVIASDGLWDAATPKMVSAETRKMNCQNAAAALVKLSQKAKFDNRDDVTVVVIDLDYHDDDDDVKAHPFVGCGPSTNSDEATPRPFWPLATKGNRDPDEYDELPSERSEKVRKEIAEKIAMEKQREIEMERERLERERVALEEKRRKDEEDAMMFEEVGKTKNENKKKPNRKNAQNRNKKTATAPAAVTREGDGIQKNAKNIGSKKDKKNKKKTTSDTGAPTRACMGVPPPLPRQPPPPVVPKQQQQRKKPNKNKKNAGEDGEDEEKRSSRSDSPPKKKRNSKKNIVRKDPTMTQGVESLSNNNNNDNSTNAITDPLHVIFRNAVSLPPSPAQDHHHQQSNGA